MMDFFLPYLPLEGAHVRELFRRRLQEEHLALRRHHAAASLAWGDPELDFLVSKARPCGPAHHYSTASGRRTYLHPELRCTACKHNDNTHCT